MTYIHYSQKCPHCGRVVVDMTYRNHIKQYFGNPIRKCKYCQGYYLDGRYSELALSDFPVRKIELGMEKGKNQVFSAIGVGCVVWFLTWYFLHAGNNSLLFASISAVAFYGLSMLWPAEWTINIQPDKNIAEEWYKSEKRLIENPNYARSLKALGADVPSRFLSGLDGAPEQQKESSTSLDSSNKNVQDNLREDNHISDSTFINCVYCGEKMPRESLFCPRCGKKAKRI